MTPGCTKEACDFRDSLAPLQAAGYTILGISRDEPEKLRRFRERDGLTYDLLSDPDHRVHAKYGVWGDKMNYGKVIKGVIRSTFVIDAKSHIQHALYNVRATGHVARLRTLLNVGVGPRPHGADQPDAAPCPSAVLVSCCSALRGRRRARRSRAGRAPRSPEPRGSARPTGAA